MQQRRNPQPSPGDDEVLPDVLAAEHDLYRQLVEAQNDLIVQLDGDGCFLFVNPAYCRTFGRSAEALIGTPFLPLVHEDDQVGTLAAMEQLRTPPHSCYLEQRALTVNGWRWFGWSDQAQVDAQGTITAIFAIGRDLTRQREAEAALEQQRLLASDASRMLQMAMDAIPSRIFWKDRDLVYQGCNHSFARDAGCDDPDQVIGRNDHSMPWQDQVSLYQGDDQAVIDSGQAKLNYIEPQTTPDGRALWLRTSKVPLRDSQENIIGVLGTYEDITAEHQARKALEESQRRLSTLMSNLPGMVYRCRPDPEWSIEFISDGCQGLTGYSSEQLIEQHGGRYAAIVHPDDRARVASVIDQGITTRQHYVAEYRIIHADGNVRWVWEQGVPVISTDGRVEALEGFITDIDDRKRAEEERQLLDEQIRQTQKLESLGVLAGGIAHDFNNILMVIMGQAEMALMKMGPMAVGRQAMEAVISAAGQASELCRQMLAYAGRSSFTSESVGLRALIEEMSHLPHTSISKKAILNLRLERGLPPIQADPAQLRQIIMNLVINASEAIGDRSGVITVAVGATRCDADYLSRTELADDLEPGLYIHLEVSDTGCGMDEETRSHIFEPFFTTKFTGRGLGLAAVLGIVRSHNGGLKVYSEPDKGTTFKILFPAISTAQLLIAAEAVPADHQTSAGGTVLLVDDEESLRALGAEMLEMLGFTVLTAEDGRQAVELFRREGAAIDLVILDLTMPHMDGAEAFTALRQLNPTLAVVLASGYSQDDVAARFAGKRLSGVLQKPYTISKLRELLNAILPAATEDGP